MPGEARGWARRVDLALHVIGWGSLLGLIASRRLALGDGGSSTSTPNVRR
jgi:hypothetical protein